MSTPISAMEMVLGYVGAAATKAAATKSVIIGGIMLATSAFFVPICVMHPAAMVAFLLLTCLAAVAWIFKSGCRLKN